MEAIECGRRIQMARGYANGMSQKELAEKIGISRGTLWKMEKGKKEVRRGVLWEVSEACQLPMWVLENPWHQYPRHLDRRGNGNGEPSHRTTKTPPGER